MAGKEGGSHSHNAHVHQGLGTLLKPYLEETLLHHFSPPQGAGPIHYADFGCGSAGNTLNYAKFVVEILKMKPEIGGRDFFCHFADLPSNDFNALFNQFPPIAGLQSGGHGDGSVPEERTWFASGVPGSQYGRMFPRSSLHVAITTLSLHFLSEIPESVRDKSSPAYNKGYISAHGTSPAVAEAFALASRRGLRRFFECRAEEIAPGGVLAFFCTGREDHAHPEIQYSDDTIVFVHPIEKAWKELVNEGVIPEELLNSFNIGSFSPSIEDIRDSVEHPTSAFQIQNLEFISDFRPFPDNAGETMFRDEESFATILTSMIRSGLGPKITLHLGPGLTDALFARIRHNYAMNYPKWKAVDFFMPLSLCLAVLIRK